MSTQREKDAHIRWAIQQAGLCNGARKRALAAELAHRLAVPEDDRIYQFAVADDDLDVELGSATITRIERSGKRWDSILLSAAILLLIAAAGMAAGIWAAVMEFQLGGGL